jgi:hypothetical protein
MTRRLWLVAEMLRLNRRKRVSTTQMSHILHRRRTSLYAAYVGNRRTNNFSMALEASRRRASGQPAPALIIEKRYG